MDYFKRIPEQPDKKPLSAEAAQEIFELLKAGKDETTIFELYGYNTYHIEEVKKEFLDVKDEVYKKVSGVYVITPAVPPELDEEGNEITPGVDAVVYDVTTKGDLVASLPVDKLDGTDVVDTIVEFDDRTKPQTFTQFKAKYKPVAEKVVTKP